MDIRTDEQLVAAHLGGDRQALGEIYDRHADRLYDTAAAMLRDRDEAADAVQEVFLTAVERVDQLRDPSRLRPWLFAILRNEVYRRTRQRRRARPTDFSAPGSIVVTAHADPRGEAGAVATAELAESVRAATRGLDPRDQLVLELSVRQGLTGTDLAAALGVSPEQSYVLVHRMRERIARSLDALAVARAGRRDCPELDRLLGDWDGELTVLIRKRVARHVESCTTCGATKRRYAGLVLFAAAPAFAAPPALRALVVGTGGGAGASASDGSYEFTAEGGFPAMVRTPRSGVIAPLLVAVLVLVLVLGGAVALSRRGSDQPSSLAIEAPASTTSVAASSTSIATTAIAPTTSTSVATTTIAPATMPTTDVAVVTTAASTTVATTTMPTTTTSPPPLPAPGRIELSADAVDLGAESTAEELTLANTGGTAAAWAIGGEIAPFTWSSGGGSLGPGESTTIEFALDRSGLPEGTESRAVTITSDGEGGGVVEVRAAVERPPDVEIVAAPAQLRCPSSVPAFVRASVADGSPLGSVVLSWSGPGDPGSATMRAAGDDWTAALANESVDGTWSYLVTATDARGNVGVADGVFTVDGCGS